MSKNIDAEFADVVQQINTKVKEIALAMNELKKFAEDAGINLGGSYVLNPDTEEPIRINGIDLYPLEDLGWSSSSMSC